jgi:hypothetical protein
MYAVQIACCMHLLWYFCFNNRFDATCWREGKLLTDRPLIRDSVSLSAPNIQILFEECEGRTPFDWPRRKWKDISRVAQIKKKIYEPPQIIGAERVIRGKFLNEDTQMLGATATWRPNLAPLCWEDFKWYEVEWIQLAGDKFHWQTVVLVVHIQRLYQFMLCSFGHRCSSSKLREHCPDVVSQGERSGHAHRFENRKTYNCFSWWYEGLS